MAPHKPLLIDEYLGHATEIDVDAASDGKEVLVGAIWSTWKKQEYTGIPLTYSTSKHLQEMLDKIDMSKIIGIGLNIVGCFNIQFAIQGEDLYVLEVNPRSSRTVPFVAKSSGLPLARIAANITIEFNF